MSAMRIVVYAMIAIKFLVAIYCIGLGFFLGVIGLGPDGPVPAPSRYVWLSFFFGGIGLAYPFSLVPAKKVMSGIVLVLATLPLCIGVALRHYYVPTDHLSLWIFSTVSLFAIVVTFVEWRLAKYSPVTPANNPRPQSELPVDRAGRG